MAKKKHQQPTAPVARWLDSDVAVVLAWLDYTLKPGVNLTFKGTVVAYLKQSLGKDFTLQRVERKMRLLWDSLGLDQSKRVDDVYDQGTCAFRRMPDGTEETYADVSSVLEIELIQAQLSPRRQLRSTSRLDGFPSSRHASLETFQANIERTPHKELGTPTCSAITSAVKREIELVEDVAGEIATPRKRKKQAPTAQRTYSLKHTTNRRQPIFRRKTPPKRAVSTRSPTVVADSQGDISDEQTYPTNNDGDLQLETTGIDSPSSHSQSKGPERQPKGSICCRCGGIEEDDDDEEIVTWIACDNCKIWQHNSCVGISSEKKKIPENCLCDLCSVEVNGDRREQNQSSAIGYQTSTLGADPMFDKALEEIKQLRGRLADCRGKLQRSEDNAQSLQAEMTFLKHSQRAQNLQSGERLEELDRNHKKIKALERELSQRDYLDKFTKLSPKSYEIFGKTNIAEGFRQLYYQSQQLLCQNDAQKLPFDPPLEKYGKLRNLVCRAMGMDTDVPISAAKDAMNQLSTLSPDVIVRALTTSALREWVFETDFPNFDDRSSELLAMYQENLVKQDGALTLRNLDLSAHHSMTQEPNFRKQTILTKAEGLAVLLSQTLAPLFSNTPERRTESNFDGFATWRDDEGEWKGRQRRLTHMFSLALTTKADSLLNIMDYEMVSYPPGTKFDEATMEVAVMEGVLDPVGDDHEGKVVDLCIEAAIYAYRREELSDNSSRSEAVVQSRNFVRNAFIRRAGKVPLVKAAVVLKGERLLLAPTV